MATSVTTEALVHAPLASVWRSWTDPDAITQWNFASDDWHCPCAANDLRVGGTFSSTMAAKDGSISFEFGGVYDQVEELHSIAYTLGDGRKVSITFSSVAGDAEKTKIVQVFDAEEANSVEMQQRGWQAILNNFAKYVEAHK